MEWSISTDYTLIMKPWKTQRSSAQSYSGKQSRPLHRRYAFSKGLFEYATLKQSSLWFLNDLGKGLRAKHGKAKIRSALRVLGDRIVCQRPSF
jgi:hypothetical protein